MVLTEVADGVLVQQSDFMLSNTTVVRGAEGVLLVDVGILGDEIVGVANELSERGLAVVAGFSTHPHWDHVLWHPDLGSAPRYGTAQGAAMIQGRLSDPGWKDFVSGMIPADIVAEVPLNELFGQITGLASEQSLIPWNGPRVRVIEHSGHAGGHAALLVEGARVLLAGDMLSDVLVPILNAVAPDAVGDYLAALDRLETLVDDVEVVIPGHGRVGSDMRARIALDRAYVSALREGAQVDDPRVGTPEPGWEWVAELHEAQQSRLNGR